MYGMAGIIGSLDCTHICWKIAPLLGKDCRPGKQEIQQLYWKLLQSITGGSDTTHSGGRAR